MAVSNVTVKQKYAGDGLTTSFPIPFTYIPGELAVIKVAVYDSITKEEVLPVPTFSLSPVGDSPTEVVFAIAPLATQVVIVYRTMPLTQVVDYIQNGAFLAEDHEKGLDRIVMMVQQLADVSGRAIQLDILDDGAVDPVLPPAEAGHVLGFNATADGLTSFPATDFIGPAGEINGLSVSQELEYTDPTPMSVTNVGTATNAVLDFKLRIGRAATIAVGTVTTVPPEDPATITNSGTSSDAIFNFEIPKGEKGSTVLVTVEPLNPNDAIGGEGDIWIDSGFSPASKGNLYQKLGGTYTFKTNIIGPPGGVTTFNTRTGDILPANGDYTASQITYSNVLSGLTATEVQAAIDELAAGGGAVAAIQLKLKQATSTGVLDGLTLAINGDNTKFDIAPGVYEIADHTDINNPVVTTVNYAGSVGNTVTNIATQTTTYILLDAAGAITQQSTYPTPSQRRSKAFVGRINHSNNINISFVDTFPDYKIAPVSSLYDLMDALAPFKMDQGLRITPNGANLSLNKSSGAVFFRADNYSSDKTNPHTKAFPQQTLQAFRKITSTTTVDAADVTVIEPGYYDATGSRTAIPGSSGRATIQRVYQYKSGAVRVAYGQQWYANLSEAVAAVNRESFVENPTVVQSAVLIAFIVVTKGCTDLTNANNCLIIPASRFGSSTGGGGGGGGAGIVAMDTATRSALGFNAGQTVYDTDLTSLMVNQNTGRWGRVLTTAEAVVNQTTLANSDSIFLNIYDLRQEVNVAGASGAIVTDPAAPFLYAGTKPNGLEVTLIGMSDTNTVTVRASDSANGILGYDVTLQRGTIVTYKWNASLNRWLIKAVSN